jgi:hypothetical protein
VTNRLTTAARNILSTTKIRNNVLLGVGVAVLAGGIATPAMASASSAPTPASAAAKTTVGSKSAASVKVAAKTAAKPAAKRAAPAMKDLMPRHITAAQTAFKPTKEQMANARKIIETGQKKHLKPRAWVIALATASQESQLKNLGNLGARNDHDSQGLFQQRPSSGWGTVKQVTNPEHAAGSFYNALVQVHNWDKLPATVAAQKVQVSAFPDHYAKWEKQAINLVLATYGVGPYANIAGAHS